MYGSYHAAAAITPHDDTVIADGVTDAIYVGGAGNATILMANGQVVAFPGLLAGTIYPIRAQRVNSTGTTATNLKALYSK